jgi:hypothetical protein
LNGWATTGETDIGWIYELLDFGVNVIKPSLRIPEFGQETCKERFGTSGEFLRLKLKSRVVVRIAPDV